MSQISQTTLPIVGELTIFRAMELQPQMLAKPAPEQMDLSGVTDLDSAGVQLLMMAKKNAQIQGKDLQLCGHSPAVLDVFEQLNVAGYFGDHLVMDANTKTSRS